MDLAEIEVILRSLDARTSGIEQKLPALVTRDEFETAMAKVATKADLQATRLDLEGAIADLGQSLRREMRGLAVETRRHFDVVAESLRGDIRLLAEGQALLIVRLDRFEDKVEARFERRRARYGHGKVIRP